MKKAFLIAIVVLLAGSFASCKKCSTCSWKQADGQTYTAPETCGSKAEIEVYEKEQKQAAEDVGSTATCTGS